MSWLEIYYHFSVANADNFQSNNSKMLCILDFIVNCITDTQILQHKSTLC